MDGAGALTAEAMVQRIFDELDADKDGRLNFAECQSLAERTGGSVFSSQYPLPVSVYFSLCVSVCLSVCVSLCVSL